MKFCLGLILLTLPGQTSAVQIEGGDGTPLASVNVLIRAGAATDPKGQSGISKAVAEMLLRGTAKLTQNAFEENLDALGAQLNVDVESQGVVFRGLVLSENLDSFLNIFEQVLSKPRFERRSWSKLKKEMLSQIGSMQGDDQALARHHHQRQLFSGHPYGRPIHGKSSDIKDLGLKTLEKHFERYYHRAHMSVFASGSVDKRALEDWEKSLFEKLPPKMILPPLYSPTPRATKRVTLVHKPRRTQSWIYISQIGVAATDSKFIPLRLANHAFGGPSFLSRLIQEVRIKRGWSYNIGSSLRLGSKPHSWTLSMMPSIKDTPRALKLVLEMIADLSENGITAEEFKVAKQALLKRDGFRYHTPAKRLELSLLEKMFGFPRGFYRGFNRKTKGLSLEDVNESLASFLNPEALTITVLTHKKLRSKIAKVTGVLNRRSVWLRNYRKDL